MDLTIDLAESDTWPVEKVEALRELWAKGVKKSDIAAQLNVSPHAITGKVYRMKFQREDATEKKISFRPAKKMQQTKPASKPLTASKAEPTQSKPPAPLRNLPEVPTPNAKPWLQRGLYECCFPVGQPERPALQMACCNKTTPGKAYCTDHQERMFQQDRRK